MNRHLKNAAAVLLPNRVFTTISSIRSRNYQQRLHREWGVSQATREMINSYGSTVLAGPFRGMRYPDSSLLNRDGIPIVFGTYELELHQVIEEVAAKKYDKIVDIGSAEGYYAVGLALRTRVPVIAFDCEPRERHYLRQMASLNGLTDLVTARPWCDSKILRRTALDSRCLVICDCEGYEMDLFTDSCVSALRHSDLIIELHETIPGISVRDTLLRRFGESHSGRLIEFDPENIGSSVPPQWRKFAREFRAPGQMWVYLTPHPLSIS